MYFALALPGQAQQADVNGWGKIRWGMTLDEASKVYIIDRHEDNDYWSQLIAQPMVIGDLTMRVSIAARHGSQEVSRVRLTTNIGGRNAQDDFDTLKAQLIQKYGPPIDGETRAEGTNNVRTFLWTFPSTSIRLTVTENKDGQGRIEVEYNATDKAALDLL